MCAPTQCGVVGAVETCVQFGPVPVHRAKMVETDHVDKMRVNDFAPRAVAAKKRDESVTPGGSLRTRAQMISLIFAGGASRTCFADVDTDTSTSLKHLTQPWSRP